MNSTVGRSYQLEAEVYSILGQLEKSLWSYERAIALLERDVENREHLGSAFADFGMELHQIFGYQQARPALLRALNLLSATSDHTASNYRMIKLLVQMYDHGFRAISDAEDWLDVAGATDDKAELAVLLGGFGLYIFSDDAGDGPVSPEFAELAIPAIAHYAEYLLQEGSPEMMCGLLLLLHPMYEQGLVPPRQLLSLLDRASSLLNDVSFENRAIILGAHAAFLSAQHHIPEALTAALAGVAYSDVATLLLTSTPVRQMTGVTAGRLRALAIDLSLALGDHRLVAELIESSRIPATSRPLGGSPNNGPISGALSRSSRALVQLQPISVGGESALARFYPTSVKGETSSLENLIFLVAGERAWWWSTFIANGNLYWATRSPDGDIEAGSIEIPSDDTPIPEQLRLATRPPRYLTVDDLTYDDLPMVNDPESENNLMQGSGRFLMPVHLRSEIGRRARERLSGVDSPINLVVSGETLAKLPAALLGVDEPGGDLRLCEGAVLSFAPPSPVANLISLRPPKSAYEFPVKLTVMDADGEFEHMHGQIPRTELLLTGSTMHVAADVATEVRYLDKETLVSALREEEPGSAGVFFYSGHVHPGLTEGDLGSGLALGNGDVLTANEIFLGNADEALLPFPARALLAACASSGAVGAGRGEWLGLGGALLAAGTRQFVGTAWPVWDTPESASFERGLVEMLVSTDDVARGLRDAQVTQLVRWRSSSAHTDAALACNPILWAAYQFIGIRL